MEALGWREGGRMEPVLGRLMQHRVKSRRLNKGWAFLTQGAPFAASWEGLFLAYVLDPDEELA